MTLPISKDVMIKRGDTFLFSFCIKDRVGYSEVARNLTGYTAAGMVRSSPESSSTLKATMTFSSSVGDLTAGIIRLNIPWATTAAIVSGVYYYDVVVTDTATNKQTYFDGKFTIEDRLTS